MITIKNEEDYAILADGIWTSKNKSLERLLNAINKNNPIGGDIPDPEMERARIAIKEIGGQITKAPKQQKFVEGRIY